MMSTEVKAARDAYLLACLLHHMQGMDAYLSKTLQMPWL